MKKTEGKIYRNLPRDESGERKGKHPRPAGMKRSAGSADLDNRRKRARRREHKDSNRRGISVTSYKKRPSQNTADAEAEGSVPPGGLLDLHREDYRNWAKKRMKTLWG